MKEGWFSRRTIKAQVSCWYLDPQAPQGTFQMQHHSHSTDLQQISSHGLPHADSAQETTAFDPFNPFVKDSEELSGGYITFLAWKPVISGVSLEDKLTWPLAHPWATGR